MSQYYLLILQTSIPILHVTAANTNDEYAVPQKTHKVSTTYILQLA